MKKIFGFLFVALLLTTSAYAQAPCDGTYPTSGTATAGQAVTLYACHNSKDNNGTTVTITGWALYDGTTRTTPSLVADTVVSATGYRQYSLAMTAPSTAGVHSYTLAAVSANGEGTASSPFALTVSLPAAAPSAPTKLRVQ